MSLKKSEVVELNKQLVRILDNRPEWLQEAIMATNGLGQFSLEDIDYALKAWLTALRSNELVEWKKSISVYDSINQDPVLLILAGNLPLVGFQDVLAALLSGASTIQVKVSRKDPFIIPTILNNLNLGERIESRLEIKKLTKHLVRRWMFTGDQVNFIKVKDLLIKGGWLHKEASVLTRKASFSLFLLDQKFPTPSDLYDAFFRYKGKGCRSVGAVITATKENGEAFIQYLKKSIEYDPTDVSILESAFINSLGYDSYPIYSKIFTNDPQAIDSIDKVGIYTYEEWKALNIDESKVQSVYVLDKNQPIESKSMNAKKELLSTSQSPNLMWKPDGIDTLKWLVDSYVD